MSPGTDGRRFVLSLALLLVMVLADRAAAASTEQREFLIYVDGKEAGQSQLTVVQQDDGATYMKASVAVKVQRVVVNFSLTIDAQEWWKDGKLAALKTQSVENGKKAEVVVAGDAGGLRVRIGGQERAISPDVWTSSFWKLADARFHNKAVPVLDVDTGKEYPGQLQYVGTQQLKVVNELQNCYHFRVTGGPSPVDLWYDQYHRLVRQEFTESGHRTIVQLVGVRR